MSLKVVVAASVMSLLCLVAQLQAYDTPVHLSLTMMLAERVGFSRTEAFELAKYDQATDDDPATTPYTTSLQQRRNYHFALAPQRQARRQAAFDCVGRPWDQSRHRAAGQYLHVLQDGYSHGQSSSAMQFAVHEPDGVDYPPNYPDAFVAMIRATFGALIELRQRCGSGEFGGEAQARMEFAPTDAIIARWARDEKDGGQHSPAMARWNLLLHDVYGPSLTAYPSEAEAAYNEWLKTQNWRRP